MNPLGSLLQASDGKLYGMTSLGGSTGSGVIFSLDPSTSNYTKLKDLPYASGNDPALDPPTGPTGSLMQASDGKLYGMTTFGGNNSVGIIFSFDPSSSTYTKLVDLDITNGANPTGSLMQATNGKLYGLAAWGGSNGYGVIFSFDPSTSIYAKLKDFDDINGAHPKGSLIQASDGKLYGIASYVIFSFNPPDSGYTTLHGFDAGGSSIGSLMQAIDGKLYGMTSGDIFSFVPSTSTYTKLMAFGTNEKGTGGTAGLIKASDGILYGMASGGGSNGAGVIFSFEPSAGTYTKLKDFDNTNGASPYGSLIQASDGKLYGLTHDGGSNGVGVIFSFDPLSSTYTKLKDFDTADGIDPYGSLMQASDGKLYGMTYRGGSNTDGVIFSFDPSSATYKKLMDFANSNGANPEGGSLIQAGNGKLYGLTSAGGSSGDGVIFSFDPVSSTYAKLKDFDITDGRDPFASLIQAGDGKLYGMTHAGGSGDYGVIFSFDPASSTYIKLKEFDKTDGNDPEGNFMQASDGKLYGMTLYGGTNDDGVIFSFDPATSTFKKLKDFDKTNGALPYIGSAFIEVPESGPLPVTLISFTGKNNGISNQLSWKVNNEQNLNYYELQRSTDGQNFKDISQIKAAGNNSYTYNDPIAAAVSSLYYYRLKSVDKDGRFTYSAVIKIRTDHNGFAVVNPNPFKDKLVVNVESLIQDKATFIITDISGRQLYKENKLLSPGTNVVEINETGRLSKGTYLLTIIASQQTQSIKVVKGN